MPAKAGILVMPAKAGILVMPAAIVMPAEAGTPSCKWSRHFAGRQSRTLLRAC
jgi:hypothetical protein